MPPETPERSIIIADRDTDIPLPTVLFEFAQAADTRAAASVFTDFRSRKSANTLRAHDADLELFAAFLSKAAAVKGEDLATRPPAWEVVTWGLIEAFIRHLVQEGYAVTSVNRCLSTIKRYSGLAFKAGAMTAQQYALVKTVTGYSTKEGKELDKKRKTAGAKTRRERPGAKKAQHTRLAAADANRLMNDHPFTPQGRRDRVLMCMLIELGLRCGELAIVEAQDVDLENGTLTFYRPKVDKTQRHILPETTLEALQAYYDAGDMLEEGKLLRASQKGYNRRDEHGNIMTTPPRLTSEGMSERAINKRVRELGKAIGITTLSPHDLRHYWATDAARAGTDPFSLQDAGGWNSLAMPRRYVESSQIANVGIKRGKK